MLFKIGVLKSFATGLQGLQLYEKETATYVLSCGYCTIFTKSFLWNTSGGCFCQPDKVTVRYWAFADLSLIKEQCGMVSTKKICRSGQRMSFLYYFFFY